MFTWVERMSKAQTKRSWDCCEEETTSINLHSPNTNNSLPGVQAIDDQSGKKHIQNEILSSNARRWHGHDALFKTDTYKRFTKAARRRSEKYQAEVDGKFDLKETFSELPKRSRKMLKQVNISGSSEQFSVFPETSIS